MSSTFRISAVAALGGLLFGFDTAVISGTIPFISIYFGLNSYSLGWAVGCVLIGCALGAIAAGPLADKCGRRWVLRSCAVLFALSGLGAAMAIELPTFIVFRILGGIGVGAAAMVAPMYIAENVPAAERGKMVSLYQLAIVSGILLAYAANYFFEPFGQSNWRWMLASQTLPAVVFFVLLLTVPESLRWLSTKGATRNPKGFSLLRKGPYKKLLIIGISIAVFQQITGINAILYYAPVIFKETGLNDASSILQTIGIGIINVIATFIAIGFVDRVGRRKFLLAGSILMGCSLTVIGTCFYISYFQHYIVLTFTLLYVAAFGCTLGAVTWVYIAEIFPNHIRAKALSVTTLAIWLADFLVSWSFPLLANRMGTAGVLYLYAGCCVAAFTFFFACLPETKGQTLEEIETMFITKPAYNEKL